MRREFPNRPVLCVGGVVIEQDKVVLVRRGHPPQKGEWTIPGGAVELDEKLEAAVRREVREETRLFVEPMKLLTVFERIVRSEGRVRYHYVVLDYACKRKQGHVNPASDVLDARWVLKDQLKEYRLRPASVSVIQQAFEFFDRLK
jgi:8-oxo-dGTP diphosphatase